MVKKQSKNRNIRKTKKKTMRGGKKNNRKNQRGGARSNYCLYSSANFAGYECSNWDGIVMLTKGLNPDQYLYKNRLRIDKKQAQRIDIGEGSTIDIIKKALNYANDYLGIFKLSYFIKTIEASWHSSLTAGYSGRNYEDARGRYSPRGFWNGTKDSKFRNAELKDFNKISNELLNLGEQGVTFSINDLSNAEEPWFLKITNLDDNFDEDKINKDSAEYICSVVKDKPVNLTFVTTGGELGGESEMKVMSIQDFIIRTFGPGNDSNPLKSQRSILFNHISYNLWKKFCGDKDPKDSNSPEQKSCNNSFKGKDGFKIPIFGKDLTGSKSRQPYRVKSIRALYRYFVNEDEKEKWDVGLAQGNTIVTDQDFTDKSEEPIDYLTNPDKNKNREEYKLLSFDPFTNYENISEMVDESLSGMSLSDLDNLVFGSYVSKGSGSRGIIQLEEFNYEILFKNKNDLLQNFIGSLPMDQLNDSITKFYNAIKLEEHEFTIESPKINHPLLIDHIIVKNNYTDRFVIVTPYYHLLKISNRLQGKISGDHGLGDKYHRLLCEEYLKTMLCKRFVGDILDMYIYKFKNTMTYPRIKDEIAGDHDKNVDGVQSRTERISTKSAISRSLEKGYSTGVPSSISNVSFTKSTSSIEIEEFKKKLNDLTYDDLVKESKDMNVDIDTILTSTSTQDEKKKDIINLLVDKIFPSGMDLSQMVRHNEFIMKNSSNPVEGFVRDNAYKNIDKTHELKDGLLVSKRDISGERIIPDKTIVRTRRTEMKCPFCRNLSVDFVKSTSGEDKTVNPSNYDDGAYYYYCNNANCRSFLGAFYREKDSDENKTGKGQLESHLNTALRQKISQNYNIDDIDIYPNGYVKDEINKMQYQMSQIQMQQYTRPDPQANSPYYQMQTLNQMDPARRMFTMDGASQVGQQIGQSPVMQGIFGNYRRNADVDVAREQQSQMVHSPQGWNTTPYALTGPTDRLMPPGMQMSGFGSYDGPGQVPIHTMGGVPMPMPGLGGPNNNPNAQTGPTGPVNLNPWGTPMPMQGFGFNPNAPQMGGVFAQNPGGMAPGDGFGGPMHRGF